MNTTPEDRVLYQGGPWARLGTLAQHGIVSVIRTPFQWVMASLCH